MKYDHFKIGVGYSHYTGTARQNIIDCAWMVCNAESEEERAKYKKELNKWTNELTMIIAKLDIINEMTF